MSVRCAIAIVSIVLLVAIGLAGRWFIWSPSFMDYGPFTGTPAAGLSDLREVQVMPLWGGRRLRVFERRPDDLAPVVLLEDAGRKRIWSVHATGRGDCLVNWIRFHKYSRRFATPRVVGTVDWNCGGRERTVWYVRHGGALEGYYYSW